MKSLDVSNNNIELIQLSDDVPTALESIYVQENRLQELSVDLLTLPNLHELHCDGNPIQYIPEEWFHTARKLSVNLTPHKETTEENVRFANQGKVNFTILDPMPNQIGETASHFDRHTISEEVFRSPDCPSHRRPVPNDLFRAIRWCVETSTLASEIHGHLACP